MRPAPAALALLLVPALLAAARRPARPHADGAPPAERRAGEVRRIRAHFDSVLAELPARDVRALTPAQRGRRAALLDTLRAYRDRGRFPHNYDFPGRAVPYFVDRGTGTLCAVAYLLAASGRRDVVDRVARADNNVLVPALAGDTAFTGWLAASGLTLAEAARVQVPYMVDGSPAPTATVVRHPVYTAGSFAALGASVATSVWNARGNARGASRVGNALGAAAGVAALGLGASTMAIEGGSRPFGAASAAAGAASVWLATRGFRRHRLDVAAARARGAAEHASVAPILPAGRDAGAGVAVALRF